MKRAIKQFLVAAVAAVVVAGCCTVSKGPSSWEYKVVQSSVYTDDAIEKQINNLAGQGWTVVSISTSYQGENTVPRAVILLKRPKQP